MHYAAYALCGVVRANALRGVVRANALRGVATVRANMKNALTFTESIVQARILFISVRDVLHSMVL